MWWQIWRFAAEKTCCGAQVSHANADFLQVDGVCRLRTVVLLCDRCDRLWFAPVELV